MISEDDALQRYAHFSTSCSVKHIYLFISFARAVADLGQSWEKVSQRVGRMAADCRDRWRNHLANREQRVTGPFL